MKKYKFIIISVIIITLFASALHLYNRSAKEPFKETAIFTHPEFKGYNLRFIYVRYIYDGDTVKLADNTVIRYLGIDTPEIAHAPNEKDEPKAREAMEVNRKLTGGKEVLLVIPKVGEYTYDRLLAYIYAPVNKEYISVTEYLLKEGLGDSKYGKPDSALPYKITAGKLEARKKDFRR